MTQATFPVSTDDSAYKSSAGYPPTGAVGRTPTDTTIYTTKSISSGTYILWNLLLNFDTSSLPNNAVVQTATLRLYIEGKYDESGDRSIAADWWVYDSTDADWTSTVDTNAHAGTTIASISVGSKDFALSYPGNFVSLTGTTGIRLHVTGGAPTGALTRNNIWVASLESTNPEAQLIIDYVLADRTRTAPDAIAYQNRFSPTLVLSDLQIDPDL